MKYSSIHKKCRDIYFKYIFMNKSKRTKSSQKKNWVDNMTSILKLVHETLKLGVDLWRLFSLLSLNPDYMGIKFQQDHLHQRPVMKISENDFPSWAEMFQLSGFEDGPVAFHNYGIVPSPDLIQCCAIVNKGSNNLQSIILLIKRNCDEEFSNCKSSIFVISSPLIDTS